MPVILGCVRHRAFCAIPVCAHARAFLGPSWSDFNGHEPGFHAKSGSPARLSSSRGATRDTLAGLPDILRIHLKPEDSLKLLTSVSGQRLANRDALIATVINITASLPRDLLGMSLLSG